MQPHTCNTCGNQVLVEKYSAEHTSIQWLTETGSACPEFARRAADGEHSNWIPTCAALRDSIARAVESGELATTSSRHEPTPGQLR